METDDERKYPRFADCRRHFGARFARACGAGGVLAETFLARPPEPAPGHRACRPRPPHAGRYRHHARRSARRVFRAVLRRPDRAAARTRSRAALRSPPRDAPRRGGERFPSTADRSPGAPGDLKPSYEAHDLVRKPVPTFRDHALAKRPSPLVGRSIRDPRSSPLAAGSQRPPAPPAGAFFILEEFLREHTVRCGSMRPRLDFMAIPEPSGRACGIRSV